MEDPRLKDMPDLELNGLCLGIPVSRTPKLQCGIKVSLNISQHQHDYARFSLTSNSDPPFKSGPVWGLGYPGGYIDKFDVGDWGRV